MCDALTAAATAPTSAIAARRADASVAATPAGDAATAAAAGAGAGSAAARVEEWEVQEVCHWLRTQCRLPQYVPAFSESLITGSMLLDPSLFNDAALLDPLGIANAFHRRRILDLRDALLRQAQQQQQQQQQQRALAAPPGDATGESGGSSGSSGSVNSSETAVAHLGDLPLPAATQAQQAESLLRTSSLADARSPGGREGGTWKQR
ncbi:MAG: hypothetical protein ACK4ZJ_18315, partial [Allorhizobium sp.]